MKILSAILLLLFSAGTLYHLYALFCVRNFFSRREKDSAEQTAAVPVSVLKPLKDADPEIAHNLASFCRQDYPDHEVLLGFSRYDGPAAKAAAAVPACGRVRTVPSSGIPGANRKIANLQALVGAARHPLLAISDSDMRAEPDYLRRIVNEYHSVPDAGMVTCLYAVTAPESLGAAMESLSIALDFIPSVLAARSLEGMTFGLGASMLVSRKRLDDIGGLASVADYLADDYQLGNRLWRKGCRIVLSHVVLQNVVGRMCVRDFLVHQLRWARTYRASRPKGFAGYGVTFIFPLALLFGAANGITLLSLSVLATSVLVRLATAVVVWRTVVRRTKWLLWLPLLPVKDIAGFCIWAWSFMGRTVSWGGRTFRIAKDGRISDRGPGRA